MSKKTIIAISIVVIFIIIIAGVTLLRPGQPAPSFQSQDFSIKGSMTCLPHKGDGPHTMECAYGLLGNDGHHYGLKNLDQQDLMSGKYPTGQEVEVNGQLDAPEPDEKYNIRGVITIKQIDTTTQSDQ